MPVPSHCWTAVPAFVLLLTTGCGNTPQAAPQVRVDAPKVEQAEVQQAPVASPEALGEFLKRVDDYVALHKRVGQPLEKLDDTKKPTEITAREVALGQAIRMARPNAKPGDIFTPQAAAVMKRAIAGIYHRSPAVRDTAEDAEAELPDFTPTVNQVYPPKYPLGTFPATLFKVLPQLPEEVEYRIVTHHLILRDVQANLIVDVLPNAIP